MRHLTALGALVVLLALVGEAAAGGWATVGFSPLPDQTAPGATWSPEITILQHGRTPLGGLSPELVIEDATTGETRSFAASETATTGVYEAQVVFPHSGRWRVVVESGFGESRLTYGPVAIGPGPAIGEPRALPLPAALGLTVLLLALVATFGVRHARRVAPASH